MTRAGNGARRLPGHALSFALGAATAVAIAGHAAPATSAAAASRDRLGALDAFAHALSYLTTDYVEPLDEHGLLYAAIRGMVARLDRHSAFYPPAAYRRVREDTEGEFGGVGCELAARAGAIVIERVIAGSPAARAGLREGDRVVAIDGAPTAGADPRRLDQRLRGPRGSRVELRVRDGGEREVVRVLIREQIRVPSVEHARLAPRVGYIKIRRFHESTFAAVDDACRRLRASPGGLGALVLDLRGNPGGVFDQAIKVADLFLAEGVIVSVRSRGEETERHLAHRAGTAGDFAMVVLIDQGSASSAELLAGALGDHGRATLVGAPTYGKGSVQTFLDLPDGSGLKLTTARYFTPAGQMLDGHRIVPHLAVEAFAGEVVTAGGAAPARAPAPARDPIKDLTPEAQRMLTDDPQLEVALRTALRGQPRGVEGDSAP